MFNFRLPAAWRIVAMLFLFQTVSTLDKLVLSLASVHIMDEMALTPMEYGTVASSLYWLFAISGVLFGVFFSNRLRSKTTLLILVCLWSLVQFPVVFVTGYVGLLVCRLLLGMFEGPGYPSVMHAAYRWFPAERRNFPTAVISQGVAFGFLMGGWLLSLVIAAYGWRSAFVFTGVIGLVWVAVWWRWGEDGPIGAAPAPAPAAQALAAPPVSIPYRRIALDRSIVGLALLLIGGYWVSSLSVSWLTPYLSKGLGYSQEQTGWLTSVILGLATPVTLGLTWGSERLLLRGWSSRLARGVLAGSAVLLAGAALIGATLVETPALKVIFLIAGFKLPHLAFVLGTAIVGDIAPPAQRGPVLHVLFAGVTSIGFVAPIVFGWIVQSSAQQVVGYSTAIQFSGALLLGAGLCGIALINPERSTRRLARSVAAPAS